MGQRRSEAILSYNQILDHLERRKTGQPLQVRAIIGHQGPLNREDETYKACKYNVMVEWETGEITEQPLSLIVTEKR